MSNNNFVIEFVVLFGFFSGFWIYAGVNPETEILKAVTSLVPGIGTLLFWIVSILVPLGTIATAYFIGKWLGLICIVLAFLGGVFIESNGVYLLLIGLLVGWFTPLSSNN
jgi:membrane-bound ClpP family serine protease